MGRPLVSIDEPYGTRVGHGRRHQWIIATDDAGTQPWSSDLAELRTRFNDPGSAQLYLAEVASLMKMAAAGDFPRRKVKRMAVARDVLELKMPDRKFADGHLHVRLYYSEPVDLPGYIVALRLRSKRPGKAGKEEQNADALAASDLLLQFHRRGYC